MASTSPPPPSHRLPSAFLLSSSALWEPCQTYTPLTTLAPCSSDIYPQLQGLSRKRRWLYVRPGTPPKLFHMLGLLGEDVDQSARPSGKHLEARECASSQRLRSALLATTPLRPPTTSLVRTTATDAMAAAKVSCECIPRPQSDHANNTCWTVGSQLIPLRARISHFTMAEENN